MIVCANQIHLINSNYNSKVNKLVRYKRRKALINRSLIAKDNNRLTLVILKKRRMKKND